MTCSNCHGDGWYEDHSDAHYADQNNPDCSGMGCPVQKPCEPCQGTGQISDKEKSE